MVEEQLSAGFHQSFVNVFVFRFDKTAKCLVSDQYIGVLAIHTNNKLLRVCRVCLVLNRYIWIGDDRPAGYVIEGGFFVYASDDDFDSVASHVE